MDSELEKKKKKDYSLTKKNYEARFTKIHLRYTDDELKIVDRLLGILGYDSRNTFIKTRSITSEQDLIFRAGIFKTLQYECRKIGVNINQIAHNLNSKNPQFNNADLQKQMQELKDLMLKLTASK